MKLNKIKPINDFVVLKATTENNSIIDLSAVSEDNKKRMTIKNIEVIAVGDKVTKVKEGDHIIMNPIVYQYNNRSLSFYYKEVLKENEFILFAKEEELIGIVNDNV